MEGVLPYKDENVGEIALNRWDGCSRGHRAKDKSRKRKGLGEWSGMGEDSCLESLLSDRYEV